MILRFKRSVTSDKLIDRDSQGPEVYSFIVTPSDEDFRGEIEMCADDCQHVSAHTSQESFFGNAKVDQLDLPCYAVIEYILWLDVSMADVTVVKVCDSRDDLFDDVLKFFF